MAKAFLQKGWEKGSQKDGTQVAGSVSESYARTPNQPCLQRIIPVCLTGVFTRSPPGTAQQFTVYSTPDTTRPGHPATHPVPVYIDLVPSKLTSKTKSQNEEATMTIEQQNSVFETFLGDMQESLKVCEELEDVLQSIHDTNTRSVANALSDAA